MAFSFVVLYIFVSYIFPGEIFPALMPYHLTYWVGVGGLLISAISVLKRRGAPLRSVQVYLLLSFFVIMAISWMLADRWWGAIPETAQQFAPSLTMFVMTICCVDSLKKIRLAMILIVTLSFIIMIQGAAAYHFGINSSTFLFDPQHPDQTAESGSDNSAADDLDDASQVKRIRGLGILHDPNDLALSFVMALPLISIASHRSKLRKVLFVLLPSAALCYGIFLTHSRGGTIGALLVLFTIIGSRYGKWRALLLVGVFAAIALLANIGGGRQFSAQEESAAGRIDAWSEGLMMLKTRPILGVGFHQFVEHNPLTAHNSFVLCFAETGLAGYFLWLGLLGITYFQLQKLKQLPQEGPIDEEIRAEAVYLQSALLGFMIAAFFLSRTYIPLLYMLLGLCTALVLISRKYEVHIKLPPWPKIGMLIVASEFASIVLIYIITKLQVIT